jgi:peroxiredoxin
MMIASALILAASLQQPPTIGKPAPDIANLPIVAGAGKTFNLKALRGQCVVVDFWATWCGPCVQSMPHLAKLAAQFQSRPIKFVTISDEPAERIATFAREHAMPVSWCQDTKQTSFKTYRVTGIPTTLLIDKQGRLVDITHPTALDAAHLEALLAGGYKPPKDAAGETVNRGAPSLNAAGFLKIGSFRPGFDPAYDRPELEKLVKGDAYQTILRPTLFNIGGAIGMMPPQHGQVMITGLDVATLGIIMIAMDKNSESWFDVEPNALSAKTRWDIIYSRPHGATDESLRRDLKQLVEDYFEVDIKPALVDRPVS